MPESRKILGQANPAADTEASLYTAPSSAQTVISTISVCNRSATPATYRIAARKSGAALANEHSIVHDAPLEGNESVFLTIGVALSATDILEVRASTADVAFSAFGVEVVA